MKGCAPDSDGTLDLAETNEAFAARFDSLREPLVFVFFGLQAVVRQHDQF